MDYRDTGEDELNDDLPMDANMASSDEEIIYGDTALGEEGVADDDVVIDAPSAAASKKQLHSSRRSIEDYLEKKRLRDELGSVFDDEKPIDIDLAGDAADDDE